MISLSKYDNMKEYHEALDKKHEEICERRGITLDRLAELNAIKMKHSVSWASWQLQMPSMTKLDFKTATNIIGAA